MNTGEHPPPSLHTKCWIRAARSQTTPAYQDITRQKSRSGSCKPNATHKALHCWRQLPLIFTADVHPVMALVPGVTCPITNSSKIEQIPQALSQSPFLWPSSRDAARINPVKTRSCLWCSCLHLLPCMNPSTCMDPACVQRVHGQNKALPLGKLLPHCYFLLLVLSLHAASS